MGDCVGIAWPNSLMAEVDKGMREKVVSDVVAF